MIRAAIVTVSDSAVAGTRADRSGPALASRVAELGWTVAETRIVADEAGAISHMVASLDVDVTLTTGGTGIAPRDVTPEAIRAIADREIPGFGEVMRAEGRKSTKFAPLSRGSAYTRGAMLVVTLPGSPRGAVDSLNAVCELIPHVVDLLHGRTEHVQKPSS
ncbi:MAG: MogA/MoaB family molybdenum cofactor biosynthesis protein [Acidobacteriia bacterium]|nr:MogA/MoaB family molybdenum cofactor biosynthesis protein [Terriglobia bacterium]